MTNETYLVLIYLAEVFSHNEYQCDREREAAKDDEEKAYQRGQQDTFKEALSTVQQLITTLAKRNS